MTPARAETDIGARIADVRDRIDAACRRAGRDPADVTVVAVTKTHPADIVRAAVAAGATDIGESYVQELLDKIDVVDGATWHLVGRLQSNKVKDVVGRVALVHSVDRRSVAQELSDRAGQAGVTQRVLVQVNVGDDPGKAGVAVADALDTVSSVRSLPHLSVEGFMTIPPLPPPGEDHVTTARPCFARLRELRDEAARRWPEVRHLSMGMSADFDAAVEEGATLVRLGTVLFGPRPDQQGEGP